MSYHDVLELVGRKTIEATVRKLRLLPAGTVARSAAKRPHRRIFREFDRLPTIEGEVDSVVPRERGKGPRASTIVSRRLGASATGLLPTTRPVGVRQ